ncbi:hypothetical protein [Caudoviricetes sp.]|nr:hypothetical protein [Caudoviricetes sp.]
MLLPNAMRDQDPQPSNPFGARKPRPEEVKKEEMTTKKNGAVTRPGGMKHTEFPLPPSVSADDPMIRRDDGGVRKCETTDAAAVVEAKTDSPPSDLVDVGVTTAHAPEPVAINIFASLEPHLEALMRPILNSFEERLVAILGLEGTIGYDSRWISGGTVAEIGSLDGTVGAILQNINEATIGTMAVVSAEVGKNPLVWWAGDDNEVRIQQTEG